MENAELEKKNEINSITIVRTALKNIKKEQLKPVADISFDLIEDIGNFFISIGELQKNDEKTYNSLMDLSDNPQLLLGMIVNVMPAEKVKKMVQLFLEISTIFSKSTNLKQIDADSKIEVGNKIISIASELRSTDDTEE